jgi:hypothetical protein
MMIYACASQVEKMVRMVFAFSPGRERESTLFNEKHSGPLIVSTGRRARANSSALQFPEIRRSDGQCQRRLSLALFHLGGSPQLPACTPAYGLED